MTNFPIGKSIAMTGVILAIALAAGYWRFYHAAQVNAADEVQGQVEQQIPAVDVVTIKPRQLRIWTEFSGRLQAVDQVDVRPRVGGAIQEVLFKEGAAVKRGDPLYIIDPRPYETAVASAEAALASAESQAQLAGTELGRTAGMVKRQLSSQSAYDASRNDYKVALAAIDAANAALKKAKLDLEYAHITAPVSGRISRSEITAGNVIEAGSNAPVLTTIVSDKKIYAEFDVDEQTYVKTMRSSNSDVSMPVELSLSADDGVVYKGQMHSFDNRFNISSGTIRARAIFQNTDGVLIPGMYAGIRLGSSDEIETMLITERAIGTDQNKRYVYIVNEENKIVYRQVTLGGRVEGRRIVLTGLKAGDKVVVNSLQRVRPDMVVKAIEVAQKQGTVRQSKRLAYQQKVEE